MSLEHLYPVEDNFVRQPNHRRSPKTLAELCVETLCRNVSYYQGELPPGLPQEIVNSLVESLHSHAAWNASSLRVLKHCELETLNLSNARGVNDSWLQQLQIDDEPYSRDDDDASFVSAQSHANENDDVSMKEVPCSLTANLTTLDLSHSPQLTDQGLLMLTNLPNLRIAKLDHCHTILGDGLVSFCVSTLLRDLSLSDCRSLTDTGVLNVAHLQLENLNLDGCRCLTDTSVVAISQIGSMRRLDLGRCDFLTDEGSRPFEGLCVGGTESSALSPTHVGGAPSAESTNIAASPNECFRY